MRFRSFVAATLLALFAFPALFAKEKADFGLSEKALYDAVIRDDRAAVDAALDAGADVNLCPPRSDATPLLAAIRTRHFALARHLVEKGAAAWLMLRQRNGNVLPLDVAAQLGDIAFCEFLSAHGPPPADAFTGGDNRSSPIFPAIRGGSLPMLQWLLQHGAKLGPDAEGIPPLSMAARWQREDIVDWLLPQANVNEPDRTGQTPVFHAVSGGNARILSTILKAGARIDWMNTENNVLAVAINLDRPETFERLLAEKPPQAALDLVLQTADKRNVSFYANTMHYYERLLAVGARPKEGVRRQVAVASENEPAQVPGGLVLLPMPKTDAPKKPAEMGRPPRVGVIADAGSRDLAALIESAFTKQNAYEMLERSELEKITQELELPTRVSERDLAIRAAGLLEGCDLLILVRKEQAGKNAYFQVHLSAAASGVQLASLALSGSDFAGQAAALRRLVDGRAWLLRADPAQLIAASVLNITSNGESRGDERLVGNLIAHQLSQRENIVVLDRENLRALQAESLGEATAGTGRFRAGTFFINGRFSGPLVGGQSVELSLEATPPASSAALARVVVKMDGGQPAELVKKATDELLAQVAQVAQSASISAAPVDATREIARLTDKLEWCRKLRLFLEEADTADAIAALGGDAPLMSAHRARALAMECRERYERSFLRWRGNHRKDDSIEHASQITDEDFSALVRLSLSTLDAVEDMARQGSGQAFQEAQKWPGFEKILENAVCAMEIPRRASERHRHAGEIEQVRQRFLQVWSFYEEKAKVAPQGSDLSGSLQTAVGEFAECIGSDLELITTNDEQMEKLLLRVAETFPRGIQAYNWAGDIQVPGPKPDKGHTAMLQKGGKKMAASADFETRFAGLQLLKETTADPREARDLARQREEMARADLAEQTRLGDFKKQCAAFYRLRGCLFPGASTFPSWDDADLRTPEFLDFTISFFESIRLPEGADFTMHRSAIYEWRYLFQQPTLLKREFRPDQLSRVRQAVEREQALGLKATGGSPSQADYETVVENAKAVFALLGDVPPPPRAEVLEIGKPICDNLRKDFSDAEDVFFVSGEAIYAKDRFWLPAEIGLQDDRYQACFLEIDPVAKTLKRHNGPLIELRSAHFHLSFSDGRLVLVQEGAGIWISATGDDWQQAYDGCAASHYRSNTGDCEPALLGDSIAFKRRLVENGKPVDVCAVTLLDLKTGASEDIVNQRRDPKLCDFDDPKRDIYALRWRENGVLQVGQDGAASIYDPAQKSWQIAPPVKGDYLWATGPEHFWYNGFPWERYSRRGENEVDLKTLTFTTGFSIDVKERCWLTIPVHFQQGEGESRLQPAPEDLPGATPGINLVTRGDTQWIFWVGGDHRTSTAAIWISPYSEFIKHFAQAAPEVRK